MANRMKRDAGEDDHPGRQPVHIVEHIDGVGDPNKPEIGD